MPKISFVIEIQRVREQSRTGMFLITNLLSKYDTSTPSFIDLTIWLQAESIHITHRPNVTENYGTKSPTFVP